MKGWLGNLALRTNEIDDTYAPVMAGTEKYGEDAIALWLVGKGAVAVMRFNKEDCRQLIRELEKTL